MLTAQVSNFARGLDEFTRLIDEHYEALSLHRERGIALDPCWNTYIRRERDGNLLYVTLRKDGQLVGYFLGFIAPGLHYKSCLTCTPDIFFVKRAARGGTTALRLIRCAERELRRRGVRLWLMGTKLHRPEAERLLKAVGFAPVEVMHAKWLED